MSGGTQNLEATLSRVLVEFNTHSYFATSRSTYRSRRISAP
jgi:hypothetical protein